MENEEALEAWAVVCKAVYFIHHNVNLLLSNGVQLEISQINTSLNGTVYRTNNVLLKQYNKCNLRNW